MLKENFKIINGKLITCGIIITNNNNDILAGHPTGKKYDKECYDILKGCCDKGEEDLDCALRELNEEAGIILPREEIVDLGVYEYNEEKNIHLFLFRTDEFPNLKKLHCKSYFETANGKMLPEMNGYKIINKHERHLFYKGIQKVLKNIKQL